MIEVWVSIVLMAGGVGGVIVAARQSHLHARQFEFLRSLGNEADMSSAPC